MYITKRFIIYVITFFIFGTLEFLIIFQPNEFWDIFKGSAREISALSIFTGSFIGSYLIFIWKEKKLSKWLFSYLVLGFYIGNLSLLFMSFITFIATPSTWSWSTLYKPFIGPFLLLILAYISGFVALSLIPTILSACFLWLIIEKFKWISIKETYKNED